MLWLVVACVKQPPPVEAVDSGRTGDSAAPDSGTDDSAETGSTPVTVWEMPGPCGAWSGVQQTGTTWTYVASDAYVATYAVDGGFSTVATVGGEGTIVLQTMGSFAGENSQIDYTRTDTWYCDSAGAWWVRNESSSTYRVGNNESSITGWRTFTPGWLVRPAVAEVGTTWTDTFVLSAEVNGIADEPVDTTCVSNVSLAETRVVDAGQFAALKHDADCDAVSDTSRWLTQYLGVIETDDELLAGYTP